MKQDLALLQRVVALERLMAEQSTAIGVLLKQKKRCAHQPLQRTHQYVVDFLRPASRKGAE
eukprot:5734286-Amphidinium_carterae.1